MDVDKAIDTGLKLGKNSIIYTAWCVLLMANSTLDGLLWLGNRAEAKVNDAMESNDLKPPYYRKKVDVVSEEVATSDSNTTIIPTSSPEVEQPKDGIDDPTLPDTHNESQSCAGETVSEVPVTEPQTEDRTSPPVH